MLKKLRSIVLLLMLGYLASFFPVQKIDAQYYVTPPTCASYGRTCADAEGYSIYGSYCYGTSNGQHDCPNMWPYCVPIDTCIPYSTPPSYQTPYATPYATPSYQTPYATPSVNNPPTVTNVVISPDKNIVANNLYTYKITAFGTDPDSGGDITNLLALINYQGPNAGLYRGYIGWSDSGFVAPGWLGNYSSVNCSGGGIGGKYNGFGPEYINIQSCSTSVSGTQRSVEFIVTFTSNFISPVTQNTLSGWVSDRGNLVDGWKQFAQFSLFRGNIMSQCNSSYNQNGKSEPSVFRPSTGTWYPWGNAAGFVYWAGSRADVPVPGDYSGDGATDYAFVRTSDYTWYANGVFHGVQWGTAGDIPVPGDYDGDGKFDIAVFRPGNATWYIRSQSTIIWGAPTDIPVQADYDGDGITDIAVFRAQNGTWYVRNIATYLHGNASFLPLPGDYNGDGRAEPAVWNPSDGTWHAYNVFSNVPYGDSTFVPVPGDYNGDGTTDLGVFRDVDALWGMAVIAPANWGAPGDIAVACSQPSRFSVLGRVFVDNNRNGIQDAGELPYTQPTTVTIVGQAGQGTRSDQSDTQGNYRIGNARFGNYIITLTVPSGYQATTTSSFPFLLNSTKTYNFGIVQASYNIAGNVFVDTNKDGIKNGSEANYNARTVTIEAVNQSTGARTQYPTTSGVYVFTLPFGTYSVTLTTVPPGYQLTYPRPPTFTVTTGPSCSPGANPRQAVCNSGNVNNLNFGVVQSVDWFQCEGGDCRMDEGFSSDIPSTATPACGGPLANIVGSSGTPGMIFSGQTRANFGEGQASTTGWVVGGSAQESGFQTTFSPQNSGVIRTSYNYMIATARQNGITPVDLATVCNLSSCSLPANLANGVYKAEGNVSLNAYSLQENKNYVFLINGNLSILGNITMPTNSTWTFSSSGNISVASTVGEVSASSATPNIEGFYSADGSFIVQGSNNCSVGPDRRLNIRGSVVVNAALGGGRFDVQRDLCDGNVSCPVVRFSERPDFMLNAPQFIRFTNTIWKEVAP